MHLQRLESLGERLLRAGVAPRHVHCYVRELHDHYDDAVQEELANGSDCATAEQAAWKRLGTEKTLAQSVLARPELRSTAARYPGLVFGACPGLIWIGSLFLLAFAIVSFAETFASQNGQEPRWMLFALYALFIFYARVLPVIFGAAMLVASVRQRLPLRWPIVGATIIAGLGGTIDITLTLAASVNDSSVAMDSSLVSFLLPLPDVVGKSALLTLSEGLARAIFMIAIVLVPYLFWRRRQRISLPNH